MISLTFVSANIFSALCFGLSFGFAKKPSFFSKYDLTEAILSSARLIGSSSCLQAWFSSFRSFCLARLCLILGEVCFDFGGAVLVASASASETADEKDLVSLFRSRVHLIWRSRNGRFLRLKIFFDVSLLSVVSVKPCFVAQDV